MIDARPFVDYYAILRVHPECDAKTLETAYRDLAKIYHPDHPETRAADAHRLPQRVGRTEQLLAQACTEHDKGARGFRIVRWQELAAGHAQPPHAERVRRHAEDVGVAAAVAGAGPREAGVPLNRIPSEGDKPPWQRSIA